MTVGGGMNRFDDGAKNYWLQYRFFYGLWKTDLYNHNFKLHLPLVCILLIEFKLMNVCGIQKVVFTLLLYSKMDWA